MFSQIKNSQHIPLLIVICGILFFVDLGGRDIWDIDEGMHAAIAQTMINSGDWVTPVFNGEAFFDKPPLFNWATAVSFLIFGLNEFAARIPAALAGLGCVLLTYSLGRKVYGASTGLIAGIVLATSLEFMLLSRVVQYDIPFTFFTTLALYLYAAAVMNARGRSAMIAGFFMAVALGVLCKGPIGLIIPGIAVGGHVLVTRDTGHLRMLLSPVGILAFFVVVTPWFVLMERANPGYLDYFIVHQHLGNYFGGDGAMSPRHPEPFYYYLPVLFAGLLPWSLTLPQAIKRALTTDRDSSNNMSAFLAIWTIGVFLFFSAATSKLSTYLLPVFPAAAILLGRYWHELALDQRAKRPAGVFFGFAAMFTLLASFAIYVMVQKPWTYWKFRTGINWNDFEIFVIVFTALIGITTILIWRKKTMPAYLAQAVTAPVLVFFISWVLVPGVDPYKGAKTIGNELNTLLPEAEKIHFYGQMLDSAMFYADRNAVMLHDEEELQQYLDSPERVFALVRTRARKQEDAFQGDYFIIRIVGNKAIVSNRAE